MINQTLYIFRHGETFVTKSNAIFEYGERIIDAPILPEGIETIKKLALYLKNIETDYNVRSNYLRVEQTAKIVTEITGKKFVVDKRLHDVLVPPPAYEEKYPEVETKEEFTSRVKSFLSDLKQSDHKTSLIGTHGGVIAAIKHLILENKFDYDKHLMDFPRPGILTIIKDGKTEEIDFN